MKRKISTKCTAIALSSIILSTPAMNAVYASEIEGTSDSNNKVSEYLFSDSKIENLKRNFQKVYGDKDEFVQHVEADGTITQVNGARGIIKVTDAETGKVEELNVFEIYNDLNQYEEENGSIYNDLKLIEEDEGISSYASVPPVPTGGHTTGARSDRANLRATREGSKIKFTANNPIPGTSSSKTYRKSSSNWYSGYTKGYYNSIRGARRSFGTSMGHFSTAAQTFAIAVASNYLKKKHFHPSADVVFKAVKSMAVGVSLGAAFEGSRFLAAYIAEMGVVFNNYLNL